jgi:hypothetical protein
MKRRKLLEPKYNSEKSLNELLTKHKLKRKTLYVDFEPLKKRLAYERKKKVPEIYPKVMHYSQNDRSMKYPYYQYLREDLIEFILFRATNHIFKTARLNSAPERIAECVEMLQGIRIDESKILKIITENSEILKNGKWT